jgi:threonine dehydrogenase-like Zn-dependent dehydrogenase
MYISPTSVLHKMDATLPVELAAMYNGLGAGVRWACHLGGVGLGDTVVVLGAGQRGIAAVVASKAAGAGTVIITGLEADAHKLAVAKEFGADHTVVVDGEAPEDVVKRVEEITGGEMADVVLELTPMAGGPVTDAMLAAKRGGTVVLAGLKGHREIPLQTDLIINRALTVRGAFGVDARGMTDAIALLESRRFPLEKMHTHSFGLADAALAIHTLGGDVPGEHAIHVSVHPAL